MPGISTLSLDWPALLASVRRPWLPPWRGRGLRDDGPATIIACMEFQRRHSFATEAEAATWIAVGRHALNAVLAWDAARYGREDVRVSVGCVRHWLRRGDPRQAELCRVELRERWQVYRRRMRIVGSQVALVRAGLSPRAQAATMEDAA